MKKKHSCSIKAKLLAVSIAASVWAASSMSASAVDFVFDLTTFTGDTAFVQVTVSQFDANTLRFTVDQPDGIFFGDLRGLFFHVNESMYIPGDLVFTPFSAVENTGSPLNIGIPFATLPSFTSDFTVNNTVTVGSSSNNVIPVPPLDIGFEFGSQGLSDDIKGYTFDITRKIGGSLDLFTFMPVNMEHFMAARVMSLWDGTSRDGSAKLTCCGTTVPEPSSTMGLLAFAVGGLLWRRRRTS